MPLTLRTALLLACLVPSVALAVPATISQQGRLLDSAGTVLDGSHKLTFTLYDAPAGGSVVWTETQTLELDAGFYAAELGSVTPIDPAKLAGGQVYLGIAVDAGAELPDRLAVTSVPFAIWAGTAGSVSGGSVDATSIKVGGVTVVDGSGKIDFSSLINVPAATVDTDTLGDLSCASDEIARFDGSAWACAPEDDHAHAADDIASGTLSVDRLPVGTGADQVSAGDHNHAAFTGQISIDSVKLGDNSAACDTSTAGAIRFSSALKVLQVCNGSAWTDAAPRPIGGAGSSSSPYAWADGSTAATCEAYVEKSGRATFKKDGVYKVDPDGAGSGAAYNVYCDMTTDGGGWTLIAKLTGNSDVMNRRDLTRWRLKGALGDISNLTAENALGASYDSVPFQDVLIRSLAKPERNLAWRHPREFASVFSVVDAGVPIFDGGKLFGSVQNLDFARDHRETYHRDCTAMKYGFLMSDWGYNDGLGIVGHSGVPHGHSGGVVGASIYDPTQALPRDYTYQDGTYTRCVTDFSLGSGYANPISGTTAYNINAHWWGAGNTYTADFRAHGFFVR